MSGEHALDLFTKQMAHLFEQKETEDNWNKFEDSILRFTEMTKSASTSPNFVGFIRSRLKNAIIQSLVTERTRLARSALNLVSTLATSLGEKFESIADIILPSVLKLTTRANKVYVSSAMTTLKICIKSAGLSSMIPIFVDSLKTPSKSLRLASMDCVVLIVETNSAEKISPWIALIEKTIAEGVVDSTPEVRDLARRLFESYRNFYPGALAKFYHSLSDMAKKYLKVSPPVAPVAVISRRSSKVGLSKENIRRKSYAPVLKMEVKKVVSSITETNPENQFQPATIARTYVKKLVNEPNDTPRAPASGAQRVARQPSNPTKPRLKAAQRVPSAASNTELPLSEESTINEINSTYEENFGVSMEEKMMNETAFTPAAPAPQIMRSIKSKTASLKAIPKKLDLEHAQLEKAVSLTRLTQDIQNPDWAIRQEVFESLERYFSRSSELDFASYHSEKSFKMMLDGLGDAHFRVVLASLGAVLAFVNAPNFPILKLELLLPRLCLVAFNPLQKSRHGIVEKAKLVIDRILSRAPPQILGQAISNVLGSPVSSGKTRVTLLGFVHSFSISSLTLCFSKPAVCKALVMRLVPFLLDQDVNILGMVKAVVLNMWNIYPDYLSQGLAHIHSNERNVLFELTGKDFLLSKPGTPIGESSIVSKNIQDLELDKHLPESQSSIMKETEKTLLNSSDTFIGTPIQKGDRPINVQTLNSRASTPQKQNSIQSPSILKSSSKKVAIASDALTSPLVIFSPQIESISRKQTPRHSRSGTPSTRNTLIKFAAAEITPKYSNEKIENALLHDKKESNTPKKESPSKKFVDSKSFSPEKSLNSIELSYSAKEHSSIQAVKSEISVTSVLPLSQSRRLSMASGKVKSTSTKSLLPKKASTNFVSKIADFRSPARVISSVTPTQVVDMHSTPKASLIKSASRNNYSGLTAKLQSVSPEVLVKLSQSDDFKIENESPARLIDSPAPKKMIDNAIMPITSPSSVSNSEPESEITVSAEHENPALSVGPSPIPSHSRIPSPSASKQTPLSVEGALLKLKSGTIETIKERLFSLCQSIQSSKIPLNLGCVTNILTSLFELEDNHNSIKNDDISYELTLLKQELETRITSLSLLQCIISAINQGDSLKPGFEFASRLIKKDDKLDISKNLWEEDLTEAIIQAMGNSSQSGVRKASFDLAFTLLSERSAEWKDEFYTKVRNTAGPQRERVLLKMMNNRLA